MGKRILQFFRGLIQMLFEKKKDDRDALIDAYKDEIAYLRETIKRLAQEREAERIEYKRAMDVLLVKEQLPIIGQVQTKAPDIDPMKMFAYMEEEVKENR